VPPRPRPLGPRLTLAEAEAHARFVTGLGEGVLWLRS
jgi:DNA polymerase-3 subunit epsilon